MERQPILPAARAERGTEAGFALIEILCVLAIIGLLAAIILPSVPRATTRAKLESYAVETAAMLKGAGVRLSGEAFRKLSPQLRKSFKELAPAVTYVPVDAAGRGQRGA